MSQGTLFDMPEWEHAGTKLTPRKLSPKQSKVLRLLQGQESATLAEITKLTGGNIYAAAEKHTGAMLANMVRRGMIRRIKPGVFTIKPKESLK